MGGSAGGKIVFMAGKKDRRPKNGAAELPLSYSTFPVPPYLRREAGRSFSFRRRRTQVGDLFSGSLTVPRLLTAAKYLLLQPDTCGSCGQTALGGLPKGAG